MPGCSVIVCTRHRPDPLARCLSSLTELDGPDPEVIVVDNTAGETEIRRVATEAAAQYVVEPRVGLSHARNAGIDAAGGELIAFIDDDAVADSAWLARHSEAHSDDGVMATTGRVFPIEKARALDLGGEGFVVDRHSPSWFERANFGGLGSGANMVFKRQAFQNGARFRETLGLGSDLGGFEDYYFWFKMIENGARIAYVPGAFVWHGPELSQESVNRRMAKDHLSVAAYVTLLLVEEPGFRGRTLRYISQVLRHKRLPWRQDSPPGRLEVLSNAYLGPLVYFRSRSTKR